MLRGRDFRARWTMASAPFLAPAPNWRGGKKSEKRVFRSFAAHLLASRRRVSPMAIGLTSPFGFAREMSLALEITGRIKSGKRPCSMILMNVRRALPRATPASLAALQGGIFEMLWWQASRSCGRARREGLNTRHHQLQRCLERLDALGRLEITLVLELADKSKMNCKPAISSWSDSLGWTRKNI